MTRRTRLLSGLLACAVMPCLAAAQNPQPAPPQEDHPTVAAPNAPNPPPEQIAPAGRGAATGNTTLSDKLSEQQGTLKPPAVDPGIQAPVHAPTRGTMPVIPPPGTPGGDQRVVPK
ncbi:MAG TPA: hypothetical protein VFL55_06180 [Acetobacteraceae bacterium]|nr:hypothetical protein [Acetobacteraceae bacterium]